LWATAGTLGAEKEVVAATTVALEMWEAPCKMTGIEVDATTCFTPVGTSHFSSH
jgi:phage baseplate assembly protein W